MTKETKMAMLDVVADSYIAQGGKYAEIGRDVKNLVESFHNGTYNAADERAIARKVVELMGITTPQAQNVENIEDVILQVRNIINF